MRRDHKNNFVSFDSPKVTARGRAVRCHCATFRRKLVPAAGEAAAAAREELFKVHRTEVFIGVFLQAIPNLVGELPLVVKLFVSPCNRLKY